MKKSQLFLTIVFSFLLAVFVSFNFVVDSAMAYFEPVGESCTEFELSGSTLSAYCETAGSYEESSINLDEVIGNSYGTLSWDSNNFSQTCRDIRVERQNGTTSLLLKATCAIGPENYVPTEINLSEHIFNFNGTLSYSYI